jgi:acyl carrier protein
MTDGEATLRRCFVAVFPQLTEEEIATASVDTVADWDSFAAVTLAALLEEEFDLRISELDLPDLRSYERIDNYLRRVGRIG